MASLGFTITVQDDQRVLDLIELLPTRVPDAIDKALDTISPQVLQEIQDGTPVGETGDLRQGWVVFPVDQGLHFRNEVEYSAWVEEGTGVFGPSGQIITPKTAKKLRFVARDGALIFTKSILGMPGRSFVEDALDEDNITNQIADLVVENLFS